MLLAESQYGELRQLTAYYFAWENLKNASGNRLSAMDRSLADVGLPASLLGAEEMARGSFGIFTKACEANLTAILREIRRVVKGSPLESFVNSELGLGAATFLFVGALPRPVEDYRTVAGLWKWCGLDVRDGKAPRRERGKKAGFDPFLRALVIVRLADPAGCKTRRSKYRQLYDARKAHTLVTHPEPMDDCSFCVAANQQTKTSRAAKNLTRERTTPGFDCAHMGGPHWLPAHRNADALRYVGKAILCDLWRVAHDLPPRTATTGQTPILRAPSNNEGERATDPMSPIRHLPASLGGVA